jgi:hypothetical protein
MNTLVKTLEAKKLPGAQAPSAKKKKKGAPTPTPSQQQRTPSPHQDASSKSPVSSIRDGNAFHKLIQRSGESPLKEETSVASGNDEESYDPSKFGIVTNILEKKKQAKNWIYKVEWMPNPTTGESYAPEWQTELYLQKSFKDLLDQFNAREKEKSKSKKVLCACLIFVIASVIAHTILVVY